MFILIHETNKPEGKPGKVFFYFHLAKRRGWAYNTEEYVFPVSRRIQQ